VDVAELGAEEEVLAGLGLDGVTDGLDTASETLEDGLGVAINVAFSSSLTLGLVPCKDLQANLMFAGRARDYLTLFPSMVLYSLA
jgi:hypothetical protein